MAPKKGKKDKEQKDARAQKVSREEGTKADVCKPEAAAVAPASVNLSPAMAELLNKPGALVEGRFLGL